METITKLYSDNVRAKLDEIIKDSMQQMAIRWSIFTVNLIGLINAKRIW